MTTSATGTITEADSDKSVRESGLNLFIYVSFLLLVALNSLTHLSVRTKIAQYQSQTEECKACLLIYCDAYL